MDYRDLLVNINIDGQSLKEIWDDCEYIVQKKRVVLQPGRHQGSDKEFYEIHMAFYNAQQNLISEGEKPIVKFKLPFWYRLPRKLKKK